MTSHSRRRTLPGNQARGSACERLMSKPSSWQVSGSWREISESQILDLGFVRLIQNFYSWQASPDPVPVPMSAILRVSLEDGISGCM